MVCRNCEYSEPDIWMKSHHDFETEVALVDNVHEWNPKLLAALRSQPDVVAGVYVYKLTKPTSNAPAGRVVRILEPIYRARGNTFRRPKNYMERRDSDKKSLAAWKSSHRIQEAR
jgi:hypothetical protein